MNRLWYRSEWTSGIIAKEEIGRQRVSAHAGLSRRQARQPLQGLSRISSLATVSCFCAARLL